ncbi:hypothetical protein [Paraburkholderia dilworthii]|uniref:hypothetical protein n=1 Tax=Paraburkholderia dilworthii TaxID=948106 RepID=UPI001267B81B|nr:hypothetical protein [Paraburkholderia dilworthii]
MTTDQWRHRPMTIRVTELCDQCNKMAEGVEARTHKSYWPTFEIAMKSCAPCFEMAKREASAEYNVTIC